MDSKNSFVKVEVFIPKSHEISFMTALNDKGYLHNGNYDFAYTSTECTGHWRPLENSNPFIGSRGEISSEPEIKLEFIIKKADLKEAYQLMIQKHPYEEPAINIIEIHNPDLM